jgi:hypothetical protein
MFGLFKNAVFFTESALMIMYCRRSRQNQGAVLECDLLAKLFWSLEMRKSSSELKERN